MLSLTGLLRRSSSCSPCPEEESELVFAQYWAALLESLPDGRPRLTLEEYLTRDYFESTFVNSRNVPTTQF
jgi:hypothetical protein